MSKKLVGRSAKAAALAAPFLLCSATWGAPIVATEGIQIDGGTSGPGRITRSSQGGLIIRGVSGSEYDMILTTPSGSDIMYNPKGSIKTEFLGPMSLNSTFSVSGPVNLSSALNVAGTATVGNGTSYSNLVLNGSAGNFKSVGAMTNGSSRWWFGANSTAESGSNAGTNFVVEAYSDQGVLIDVPFTIVRAANQPVVMSRPLRIATTSAVSPQIELTSTSGTGPGFFLSRDGKSRWGILSELGGENGANSGSNFSLRAYDDAGSSFDVPLSIARAPDGPVTLSRRVLVEGQTNGQEAFIVNQKSPGVIAQFRRNGQPEMTLAGDGKLGIGTQNVGNFRARVAGDVQVGNNATIGRSGGHYDEFGYNVGFTSTNDQYTYLANDPAASIRMGYQGSLEFRTAPSGTGGQPLTMNRRMLITEAGNVGIGTSGNPEAKLHVAGGVKVDGAISVRTWTVAPDYVFEKDYKLRSLEEVDAFVQKNKHLPEVPSAKQIAKEGLDLAEMNLLLLKKVEELTLHAIRQEKERKSESASLRAELAKQAAEIRRLTSSR